MRPTGYYDAEQIEVLPGLVPIRMRPAMYVGDVGDGRALEWLVGDLVRRRVGEAAVRQVEVRLRADGAVCVADDGLGLGVRADGEPAFETRLTTLHVPPGVEYGLVYANALSSRLEVEFRSGAELYRQTFARGVALAPATRRRAGAAARGTRLVFWPDASIFPPCGRELLAGRLAFMLAELALVTPALRFTLVDERRQPARSWTLAAPLVQVRHAGAAQHEQVEIKVELALGFDGGGVRGFLDGRRSNGGAHVAGLRQGWAAARGLKRASPASDAALARLGAVVGVWYGNARVDQGGALVSPEVTAVVADVMREACALLGDAAPPPEDALVAQLRRQPDDAASALVYADRLQAIGDARGELIALEHHLALAIDIDDAAARAARLLDDERLQVWERPGGFPFQAAYRGRRFAEHAGLAVAVEGKDARARYRKLRAFCDALTDSRGPLRVVVDNATPAHGAAMEAAGFARESRGVWTWRHDEPSHHAVDTALARGVPLHTVDLELGWSERALGGLAPLTSAACYLAGAVTSQVRVDLRQGRGSATLRLPLAGADERARINAWQAAVARHLGAMRKRPAVHAPPPWH